MHRSMSVSCGSHPRELPKGQLCLLVGRDGVSCNPVWPPTHQIVKDDPEWLLLLPLFPHCWGYRYLPLYPIYEVLGTEPCVFICQSNTLPSDQYMPYPLGQFLDTSLAPLIPKPKMILQDQNVLNTGTNPCDSRPHSRPQ